MRNHVHRRRVATLVEERAPDLQVG
jgi:hypothetical protein